MLVYITLYDDNDNDDGNDDGDDATKHKSLRARLAPNVLYTGVLYITIQRTAALLIAFEVFRTSGMRTCNVPPSLYVSIYDWVCTNTNTYTDKDTARRSPECGMRPTNV